MQSIRRNSDTFDYFTEYPVSANTGFNHVYTTSEPYLCNDIPKAVSLGKYKNPRLNDIDAREYYKEFESSGKHDDYKWALSWNDLIYDDDTKNKIPENEKRPPQEACYMSTMIIPMTLLNNEGLSDEFREHFHIPRPPGGTSKSRAIWGFLCFDHVDTDYFVEKLDIPVGYIFADMLSLILINRLNYVTYSETFGKAEKYIDKKIREGL